MECNSEMMHFECSGLIRVGHIPCRGPKGVLRNKGTLGVQIHRILKLPVRVDRAVKKVEACRRVRGGICGRMFLPQGGGGWLEFERGAGWKQRLKQPLRSIQMSI